ncbi:MAG TPA: hypothetical protein VIL71_23070 [Spirillospora sp.]
MTAGPRSSESEEKDVTELLEAASLLVSKGVATADDLTVGDVWEYLRLDEWEVALGILEELGDVGSLPVEFWERLAAAAELMRLERSAAWCHWRCFEARNGIIRADLALGARREPVPGAGVLRPMWDIGDRTPGGEPVLSVARLWVEFAPRLEPGGRASVRLAPLDPSRWRRLRPGQVITMHENRAVAGTAVVLDVRPPS